MQFVLMGYDGDDDAALERRLAVRENHLAMCAKLKAQGNYISGGAILNDDGKMIGSVIFYDFPSREEMELWLRTEEPYVLGDVWRTIQIHPFRLGQHPTSP
ncbi:MAG: YciI family protein [Cyanobacteria bacterium]|nr:YciI family protein [Cyanobacteriota bacterium]